MFQVIKLLHGINVQDEVQLCIAVFLSVISLEFIIPKSWMNNNSQIFKWYCQFSISLYFWTSFTMKEISFGLFDFHFQKRKMLGCGVSFAGCYFCWVCLLGVSRIKLPQGRILIFGFLFFFGAQTSQSTRSWIRV